MNKLPEDLTNFLYQSHTAGLNLGTLPTEKRNYLILKIADAIKQERNSILEANTYDLEASRDMAIPELLLEWMKLTPDRLHRTIDYLKYLADVPDPLAQSLIYNQHNQSYKTVPLGSVALIYEALPHLVIIMTGMALKSGNSLVLKGGTEVSHSQAAIADVIGTVIRNSGLELSFAIAITPPGTAIKDLITQEKYLRLIIPYGRPSFVQQIAKQTTLSILPAAMGNCYMYLGATANLEKALEIIKSSRQGDPDPVNAIEKVLVHGDLLSSLANWICELKLQDLKIKIKGCDRFINYCRNYPEIFNEDIEIETQWGQAYLDDTLAIKIVDNLDEVIAWIDRYSSGHADVIMSDSVMESQNFANRLKSSNIYVNAASKFNRLDGDRPALGMVSAKTRGTRGIIDLQALTTTKRIITPIL